MRLTFLGTGTSFGVPQIGCDCPVCRSTDPRDKRTRSGAILQEGGASILIDTPPELRLQLIAGGFSSIDAVAYTHEHADHINGIDGPGRLRSVGGLGPHKQTAECNEEQCEARREVAGHGTHSFRWS